MPGTLKQCTERSVCREADAGYRWIGWWNLVVSQFPYCPKTDSLGRKMIAVIRQKPIGLSSESLSAASGNRQMNQIQVFLPAGAVSFRKKVRINTTMIP